VRNASDAQDPNIKTSNYLNSLLALREVKGLGADDALLCNRQGHLTEGTTFSVFAVTAQKELITPSLRCGILDSITRRHVIECAKAMGISVSELEATASLYHQAKEIFIASSVREVVPVHTWDDKHFVAPGELTAILQEKLSGVIKDYVATHPKF
jgi:branched-chain amino acid aminotransferase